jgi:hypothetical protein
MELSQDAPATPAAEKPLAEEIRDVLAKLRPTDHVNVEKRCVDGIMQLLMDRGHYLPGAPPAQQILEDAKSFAERLTLTTLALRILNMLAWEAIQTPESKPARRWLDDYLEGKNHGPVGHPMLWPARLPGLAHLLTEWGFQPTPTRPAFVARVLPNPTVQ